MRVIEVSNPKNLDFPNNIIIFFAQMGRGRLAIKKCGCMLLTMRTSTILLIKF